jgi:hypothetical protein
MWLGAAAAFNRPSRRRGRWGSVQFNLSCKLSARFCVRACMQQLHFASTPSAPLRPIDPTRLLLAQPPVSSDRRPAEAWATFGLLATTHSLTLGDSAKWPLRCTPTAFSFSDSYSHPENLSPAWPQPEPHLHLQQHDNRRDQSRCRRTYASAVAALLDGMCSCSQSL